jgi:membrane protein implicated in regulation of membrane protease activity
MDPGLIWILVGLVLLAADLVLPGVFLLWVGLAAIGTGLVVLLMAPLFWQVVVVFLLLLAAGIATALRLTRDRRAGPVLNTPDAGLVGRHGVLLPPEGPQQRVRIGDSDWPARLVRHAEASPGAAVRVEAVDGTTLVVRPLGT